jgi:hypothetical protein
MLAAVEDGVEGAVELAVATATESMSDRLAARGGDRRGAGQACEGGFGADEEWFGGSRIRQILPR